jgi:hypothetical protein
MTNVSARATSRASVSGLVAIGGAEYLIYPLLPPPFRFGYRLGTISRDFHLGNLDFSRNAELDLPMLRSRYACGILGLALWQLRRQQMPALHDVPQLHGTVASRPTLRQL